MVLSCVLGPELLPRRAVNWPDLDLQVWSLDRNSNFKPWPWGWNSEFSTIWVFKAVCIKIGAVYNVLLKYGPAMLFGLLSYKFFFRFEMVNASCDFCNNNYRTNPHIGYFKVTASLKTSLRLREGAGWTLSVGNTLIFCSLDELRRMPGLFSFSGSLLLLMTTIIFSVLIQNIITV